MTALEATDDLSKPAVAIWNALVNETGLPLTLRDIDLMSLSEHESLVLNKMFEKANGRFTLERHHEPYGVTILRLT
jgi:hypothetical protein